MKIVLLTTATDVWGWGLLDHAFFWWGHIYNMIIDMLTTSPDKFKGGTIWNVIEKNSWWDCCYWGITSCYLFLDWTCKDKCYNNRSKKT